ncbi:MAG: polyisoprenoid-binding protein YceI [Saprospiraceae bacterium]|jgi:polyisoprenoid-binding protein YceI
MKNLLILLLALGTVTMFSCKKASGEEAKVSEAAAVATSVGQDIPVSLSSSVVNWEGAKPTGTHTGTISLSEGVVTLKDGEVAGGSFTLDMTSITNTDQEGDMKAGLEAHLKGLAEGKEDHFFNTPVHPTGKFEITKVTELNNDPAASHLVYGNLTLKGIAKEVGFKANVKVDGSSVSVVTPPFTIDRTQWGVNYGSKSVFDDLGDKFVNDEIGLTITLNASKQAM